MIPEAAMLNLPLKLGIGQKAYLSSQRESERGAVAEEGADRRRKRKVLKWKRLKANASVFSPGTSTLYLEGFFLED